MAVAATFIGIDFGTTKTSVHLYRDGANATESLTFQGGKKEIPTQIVLDDQGNVLEWGDFETTPEGGTFYDRFKMKAGTPEGLQHCCRDGRQVDVIELYLAELFKAIQVKFSGADMTKGYSFIVGCPSEWTRSEQNRFRERLLRSGFPSVEIVEEPVAVAGFHVWNKDMFGDDELFLVFDFGGATMNMGVFRPRQTKFDRIATLGVEKGGCDFDAAIMKLMKEGFPEFERRAGQNERGAQKYCRILKERFSDNIAKGSGDETTYTWQNIRLTLNKDDFEKRCDDLIQLIPKAINELFEKNAGIESEQIKKILFSGGSSQFYFVREELKACFPLLTDNDIVYSQDSNHVVAKGLALCRRSAPAVSETQPHEQKDASSKNWGKAVTPGIVLALLLLSMLGWMFWPKPTPPVVTAPTIDAPVKPIPVHSITKQEATGRYTYTVDFEVVNNGAGGVVQIDAFFTDAPDSTKKTGTFSKEDFFNPGQTRTYSFGGKIKSRANPPTPQITVTVP